MISSWNDEIESVASLSRARPRLLKLMPSLVSRVIFTSSAVMVCLVISANFAFCAIPGTVEAA
jgi:hypothetical protein